ncbi:unnamed protein product [Closterium sp. Naga37s-1]|nr:unnamed protein product [Closterium sp. Naga37s-1]
MAWGKPGTGVVKSYAVEWSTMEQTTAKAAERVRDERVPEEDEEEDENPVCPLCIEELDATEIQFRPCPCGYRVCLFCYERIKLELKGICPSCRSTYGDPQMAAPPQPTASGASSCKRRGSISRNGDSKASEQGASIAGASLGVSILGAGDHRCHSRVSPAPPILAASEFPTLSSSPPLSVQPRRGPSWEKPRPAVPPSAAPPFPPPSSSSSSSAAAAAAASSSSASSSLAPWASVSATATATATTTATAPPSSFPPLLPLDPPQQPASQSHVASSHATQSRAAAAAGARRLSSDAHAASSVENSGASWPALKAEPASAAASVSAVSSQSQTGKSAGRDARKELGGEKGKEAGKAAEGDKSATVASGAPAAAGRKQQLPLASAGAATDVAVSSSASSAAVRSSAKASTRTVSPPPVPANSASRVPATASHEPARDNGATSTAPSKPVTPPPGFRPPAPPGFAPLSPPPGFGPSAGAKKADAGAGASALVQADVQAQAAAAAAARAGSGLGLSVQSVESVGAAWGWGASGALAASSSASFGSPLLTSGYSSAAGYPTTSAAGYTGAAGYFSGYASAGGVSGRSGSEVGASGSVGLARGTWGGGDADAAVAAIASIWGQENGATAAAENTKWQSVGSGLQSFSGGSMSIPMSTSLSLLGASIWSNGSMQPSQPSQHPSVSQHSGMWGSSALARSPSPQPAAALASAALLSQGGGSGARGACAPLFPPGISSVSLGQGVSSFHHSVLPLGLPLDRATDVDAVLRDVKTLLTNPSSKATDTQAGTHLNQRCILAVDRGSINASLLADTSSPDYLEDNARHLPSWLSSQLINQLYAQRHGYTFYSIEAITPMLISEGIDPNTINRCANMLSVLTWTTFEGRKARLLHLSHSSLSLPALRRLMSLPFLFTLYRPRPPALSPRPLQPQIAFINRQLACCCRWVLALVDGAYIRLEQHSLPVEHWLALVALHTDKLTAGRLSRCASSPFCQIAFINRQLACCCRWVLALVDGAYIRLEQHGLPVEHWLARLALPDTFEWITRSGIDMDNQTWFPSDPASLVADGNSEQEGKGGADERQEKHGQEGNGRWGGEQGGEGEEEREGREGKARRLIGLVGRSGDGVYGLAGKAGTLFHESVPFVGNAAVLLTHSGDTFKVRQGEGETCAR